MARRHLHLFGGALLFCGLGVAVAMGFGWRTKGHDPDALWKIVHGRCAIGGKPCAVYDQAGGYALLHSIEGRGQYLLIPTAKITGIESPALLSSTTPNYFAEAWGERAYVSQAYGQPLPDDAMSLAINSVPGRSQNQLHIHIDCLAPGMREALDTMAPGVGASAWSTLPRPLMGHRYRAILLPDLTRSPFAILAAEVGGNSGAMAGHTLVVVPEGGAFLLLDDAAHGLDPASGEELQDHTCRAFLNKAALRENSR